MAALFSCVGAEGAGIGIGPAMLAASNIVPGRELKGRESGLFFEVHNEENDKPVSVMVKLLKLRDLSIAAWEKGYEEIPDASWCKLESDEVEIPAKAAGKVHVSVNVPDKPEHYNRKWILAIACRAKPRDKEGGSAGIGIQLVCRLGIETLGKRDTDGANAGETALLPSFLAYSDAIPGETFEDTVKLRNNGAAERKFEAKKLADIETDPERHERYFGACVPVLKNSWLGAVKAFSVKPNETAELKLSITVPKDAEPGKTYEELLFLRDDKERLQFVRIRTQIAKARQEPQKEK